MNRKESQIIFSTNRLSPEDAQTKNLPTTISLGNNFARILNQFDYLSDHKKIDNP